MVLVFRVKTVNALDTTGWKKITVREKDKVEREREREGLYLVFGELQFGPP